MLPIPFGNPSTYAGHSGVDFAQREGTSIRASGPGVVVAQGWSPITLANPRAAGNWITVQYDNGPRVFYCHLRDRVTCPRNNTRVWEGDHLGPVGWTGFVVPRNVNGSHLHLAIDGQPGYANVWRYFDRNRVVGQGSGSGSGGNNSGDDDMYSEEDRLRDVQTHQAIWNDTRTGGGWAGVLERLDRLEANDRALEYTLDGKQVPADVSARQGGQRIGYWRKLGRLIAGKTV